MRNTVDLSLWQPDKSARFLYETVPGRCLLKVATSRFVSRVVGWYMNRRCSRRMIGRFIEKNHIDMSQYEVTEYGCYNDFFTRKIKPEMRPISSDGLIAPCDAKLTVYPIDDNAVFRIKNSEYSLSDVLADETLAAQFSGGYCFVFRLSVDDYHRYCYFDDCTEARHWYVPGKLHTVQPIAFRRHRVFVQNCREVTVLETDHFATAVQVEVGALCVGKIKNHHVPGRHARGEEKGMFLFGGSTVLLIVKGVQPDDELLRNTEQNKETIVKMGERLE